MARARAERGGERTSSGAWRNVADSDLVFGEGRALCRGAGWYGWVWGTGWCGSASVSKLPAGEALRTLASWRALQQSAAQPFCVMTDISRANVAERSVAEAMSSSGEALRSVAQSKSTWCRDYAVVLPQAWSTSWWSAMIANHADAIGLRLFTERAAAWEHLGAPDAVRTAVDALHDALLREDGLPLQVEMALRAAPTGTLETIAKGLALSGRSLQRTLAARGETFASMRHRVRLELAQQHLASGMQVKSAAVARLQVDVPLRRLVPPCAGHDAGLAPRRLRVTRATSPRAAGMLSDGWGLAPLRFAGSCVPARPPGHRRRRSAAPRPA